MKQYDNQYLLLSLETYLTSRNIEFVREYKFHPKRKWRLDYYLSDLKIGIEIEGGIWSGGRHTRGEGYENDCRKYNAATRAGIKIFRYSYGMLFDGDFMEDLEEVGDAL